MKFPHLQDRGHVLSGQPKNRPEYISCTKQMANKAQFTWVETLLEVVCIRTDNTKEDES